MEHAFEISQAVRTLDPWARTAFLDEDPKVIAVDFDETISDNEAGWTLVLSLLEKIGYHVVICTMRKPTEYPEDLKFLVDKGYKIHYTSRQAKQEYMAAQGIKVAIWIDDNVSSILFDNGMLPCVRLN